MMLTAVTATWADMAVIGGINYYLGEDSGQKFAQVYPLDEGKYSGDVVIPSTVPYNGDDYTVTSIWDSSFKESEITSVVIPNTVTYIGRYCFQGCKNLEEVVVPGSVTTIAVCAFAYSGLTTLKLEYGAEPLSIGEELCSESNLTEVFIDRDNINRTDASNAYSLFHHGITRATFGNHVTKIPNLIFRDGNPQQITIQGTVTEIGDRAFFNATLPDGFTFPFNNIQKIGDEAFGNCQNMPNTINLTAIKEIGKSAFENSGVKAVTLGSDLTSIGSNAFKQSTITTVNIPSKVTHIMGSTFQGCTSLTEVTLSEGLQEIGSYAFQHSAVTSLTIPGTVTNIGWCAMEAMENLTKLTFAYGAEKLSMDWSVFNGTNNITELVVDRDYIWGNNQSISTNSVKKVTFGEHLTKIPENACLKMSLDELNIGANVTAVDVCAFSQCTLPAGYNFPFAQIKEIKGNAFSLAKNLPANIDLSGVETIEYSAFSYSDVQIVKLGSGLTTFGENVFQYCSSLTTINIPGTINSLIAWWFYECTKLTNVTFDYGSTALTLEDGTFGYATNLTIDRTISGTTPFGTTAVTKVALGSHMATSPAISSLNLSQYTGLTELELLDGWTDVPYGAFKNLATVTTLTLPEGLETIGQEAFNGCTGLTAVTIPGTMKQINGNAFKGCTNLTSLTLDYSENLTDGGWFSEKGVLLFNGIPFDKGYITDFVANRPFISGSSAPFTALKRATFGSHVTNIPAYMFNGLTLEQLVVSESITDVGNYAFTNCTLPDGVDFPFSKLKKIGIDAFRGCSNLPATIDLSAIEEIGSSAFQNCTSIESLIIGGGTIGSSAFSGCTNLSSITLNEGVTEIGSSNFSNLANLATISLPSTLKKIGGNAFAFCENLTIPGGLPNGLEEIGTSAFYYCKKLNVTIPSTVTKIDQSAFSHCESLTSVTIPAGVTSLNMYTFSDCTGLTSVTIPGTLETMNRQEFSGCSNLTTVTIENGATPLKMASDVFSSSPCTNLIIDRPYEWTGSSNGYFKNTENVTFGEHVTAIPDKGLYGSNKLNTLTMTDNVTSIGEQAFSTITFSDASTKELKLSKNLQTIGKQAFHYMYNGPEALVLPISVTEIGQQALASHYTYPNTLKDVYVPWIDTPIELTNDDETYGTFRYADNQTLWIPGGTLAKYQAATGWKRFKNFEYWSFVVKATVTGKGTLKISNGEAVTDNGTNTEKTATNAQLVEAGAGEAVNGLFVREKDLTLTSTPARGYELNTLTANDADIKAASKVENLLADQTIAAKFTPIIYTLTYNLGGGQLPTGYPETYTVEDADIILPQPTRTAYNFKGWTGTDVSEATMTVTIPASSIGNREYTATWEPIVYDITYELDGGAVDPANKDKYTIETPDFTLTNPTKLGYTFIGWTGTDLTEKSMTVKVTTGHYGNRSYTATWEPNPYKVGFDINGGDGGEMADQNFLYDAAQNLTANAFTRTGYTFKEWNSKADGTGTPYADKTSVINLTATRDAVVKMYAQWTPNPYKVRFNANNGTGTMADQDFTYDAAQALTENAFTRKGYTFEGWNTKADGSGNAYADKKEVKNLTAELNGTANLYAQWKVITYTIAYDLAGGSVATANPTEYNIETANFTLTNPTKTGYTFAGWTGTDLTDATATVTITKGSIGNRSFTATWTPNTYQVAFDANNGTGTMANQSFTYDAEQALTGNTFTRTAFNFAGWNTKADGSGTPYDDKASVKNLTAEKGAVVTLYAQWNAILYAINKVEDGKGAMYPRDAEENDIVESAAFKTVKVIVKPGENAIITGLKVSYNDGEEKTVPATGTEDGPYIVYTFTMPAYPVTLSLEAMELTLKVDAAAQYATAIAPCDVDYLGDVKAYSVTGVSGNLLTLTEVTALEANKPYLLYAETGAELKLQGFFKAAEAPYVNGLLTGVYVETSAPVGSYVLQNLSGKLGFYKVAEGKQPTVKPNHAYLTVPDGTREAYFFDAATAINAMNALMSGDAQIYNVKGERQNTLKKGMNIILENGKTRKVFVK